MERYYYLTASLYDGAGWMARPGVLAFAALLVVPVLWSVVKKLRGASGAADDGHRDEHESDAAPGDELEGSLAGTPWSAAVAVVALLLFAGALWVSGSFSEEARLMPRLVAGCGLVAAVVLTWQEVRSRVDRSHPAPVEDVPEPAGGGSTALATRARERSDAPALARHHDLVVAARTFAAMAGFLVLVMVGGYLAATLVFTPVFLLYASRTRPRTAIIYTLVLGIVLLSLPTLLPVDLPLGALQ
jgi:hypothetical protein